MAVDTRTAEHRMLQFNSIADVLAELDRLEAAHRSGTLRKTGNWSPGQVLGHCATWMNFPYDGYPQELRRPPWFVRAVLRKKKKKYFNEPMPRGFRIPGVKSGTVGIDELPFEDAAARLRAAASRLDAGGPPLPNPVFGPMTHDEWKSVHLRHCALHLGFLHPQ